MLNLGFEPGPSQGQPNRRGRPLAARLYSSCRGAIATNQFAKIRRRHLDQNRLDFYDKCLLALQVAVLRPEIRLAPLILPIFSVVRVR